MYFYFALWYYLFEVIFLNIGENIKKRRKEKNMTQKELAKKLGKSTRMIQKYENSEVLPSLGVLNEISKILSIDYLNSDDDIKNLFKPLSKDDLLLIEMIYEKFNLDELEEEEKLYKLLLEKIKNQPSYITKLALLYKTLNELFENTTFAVSCKKNSSYIDSIDDYSKEILPLLFSIGIDNVKKLFNESELLKLQEALLVAFNIKSLITDFLNNQNNNSFDSSLINFGDIFNIPENKKILFSLKLVDKDIDNNVLND
ncbi:TPA: helix-turn-helix transcriptional regulator [Clostridium perfringens]|nr:helix-turn-helix domain-containing protein [Clostridium perfringens]HBI6990128.1 helix-turn-helix transcriptional regulator [Clostridium perfringens]HBI6992814.1 helix-turn-helix transcriptional regulator [Clostridium perfringens]HBI6998733.1 helix-turn-helix transcriptional regulator [Clostridium perfringens]HBI7025393.1 helix-turn-helix transcriptional regulator [Clostridium perfringens]